MTLIEGKYKLGPGHLPTYRFPSVKPGALYQPGYPELMLYSQSAYDEITEIGNLAAGLPFDLSIAYDRENPENADYIEPQLEFYLAYADTAPQHIYFHASPTVEAFRALQTAADRILSSDRDWVRRIRSKDGARVYLGLTVSDAVVACAPNEPLAVVRSTVAMLDSAPWPYKIAVLWRSEWVKELPWLRYRNWCYGVYDDRCTALEFGDRRRGLWIVDKWQNARAIKKGRTAVAKRQAVLDRQRGGSVR